MAISLRMEDEQDGEFWQKFSKTPTSNTDNKTHRNSRCPHELNLEQIFPFCIFPDR